MEYAHGWDQSFYQEYYTNHRGAKEDGWDFSVYRMGGGTVKDGTFLHNIRRAKPLMPVGGYWYIYPHRPAATAMDLLLQQWNDAQGLDIKVWMDVERKGIPVNQWRDALGDRLYILNSELGKENLGIYTSATCWNECMGGFFSGAETYPLMVAHYTSRMPPRAPYIPKQWKDNNATWDFWQYTAYLRVWWYRNGKFNLDGLRFNGDEADLQAYANMPLPPAIKHIVTVTHPEEVEIQCQLQS